jgi:hypothetical protein
MLDWESFPPLTRLYVVEEMRHYCTLKSKQLLDQANKAADKDDQATAEYKFCKVKLFTQVIGFLRGLESDILNGTDEKGA